MRIIGGTARGVKLLCPKGHGVRPIPDRVREALFNIIRDALGKSNFLDLFAGTGSVGIESLSRGVQRAAFVEKNRQHVEIIKKNLESADLHHDATVILGDAFGSAPRLSLENLKFGTVFLGPPYKLLDEPRSGLRFRQLFCSLADNGILLPDALLILQSPRRSSLSELAEKMIVTDRREYGDTVLTFMTMGNEKTLNFER